MVEFYLKYDVTATFPTTYDNGTVGLSLYYEVYHGANPKSPASGDEDIDCTTW